MATIPAVSTGVSAQGTVAPKATRIGSQRTELAFWGSLIGLNLLLFVPLFLFQLDETPWLPHFDPQGSLLLTFNQLTVWRESYDPFRISLELITLTALWTFVRVLRTRLMRVTIHLLYLFALLYYLYEALSISIFDRSSTTSIRFLSTALVSYFGVCEFPPGRSVALFCSLSQHWR